ncbi:hypothetical protein Pse7367_1427 [Thalassoporum mexicanum PCC 7367]|nr:hypothetical protein Pse7367_1427 [Pseudanabaena sp. PCC 7367]
MLEPKYLFKLLVLFQSRCCARSNPNAKSHKIPMQKKSFEDALGY